MKKKKTMIAVMLTMMLAWTSLFPAFSEQQVNAEVEHPSVTEMVYAGAEIEYAKDKWEVVPSVMEPPELDGVLDEEMWEEAASLSSFVTIFDYEASQGTEVKLAYDEDHVYIAVKDTFDAGEAPAAIEILLSPPSAAGESVTSYRIPIVRGDLSRSQTMNWGGWGKTPGYERLEGHQIQTIWQDNIMSAEISIPLAALGISGGIEPGKRWQANFIRMPEVGTSTLTSWVPIRSSAYVDTGGSSVSISAFVTNEGRMGDVYFGQLPDQAQKWTPEQARYEYKGFTEKELTFVHDELDPAKTEFSLTWVAPSGLRTEVSDVQSQYDGEMFRITHTHPSPKDDGIYKLILTAKQDQQPGQLMATFTFDRMSLIDAGNRSFAVPPRHVEQPKQVDHAEPSAEISELLELIPDKHGFLFTGLPDQPGLRPQSLYTWRSSDPWQLTSSHSSLTYPNEQYPEDQSIIVEDRNGNPVEYPYYEDEDGKRYFITAHIWYKQREYVAGQLPVVAAEDPLGAARLLYKFAQKYEGYLPSNDYLWQNYPIDGGSGPPYPHWGGMWYRWSLGELTHLLPILDAYDAVKQTNAFDLLSAEVGEDVDQKIIHDMFKPSIEFMRTFPVLDHNMEYLNWLGLIKLGWALDDPTYIHDAVERIERFVTNTYLFDGFFKEVTFSYHNQSTNGLIRAMDALKGWTDPEGYISPRTGDRYDNLDMAHKFPALGSMQDVPSKLVYPNGHYFPVQDTWAASKSGKPNLYPESLILPAAGIAKLARGAWPGGEEAEFGTRYDFHSLDITEQTADTRFFANSDTTQFEANEAGHSITFAFDVETSDQYEVSLLPFKAGTYGTYDIYMDEQLIGTLDFYDTASGVAAEPVTLDTISLTSGTHHMTFTNIGKHEDSGNFKMGVVKFNLLNEEDREQRDQAELKPDQGEPQQLYLGYEPKYGHSHFDPLHLALFAEGQELLPDIGYTHTIYRQWTMSTLAHNTVVVDGDDMARSGQAAEEASHGGNIEVFAPNTDNVQVVRAQQESAYPQVEQYEREAWMIGFPDDASNQGYVLDLFRVTGGTRHEYTLNGDANRDASFTTNIPLSEYGPYLLPPGTTVREPISERDRGSAEGHYYGYLYVRDVDHAELPDGKYELHLETSDDSGPQAGMKITGLVEQGNNELFIGQAPSLQATRMGGSGKDTNVEAVKHWMPKMVLRRETETGTLSSHFVTAMEPYAEDAAPRIEQIERIEPDQGREGDLIIAVTYGNTTDIIMSSPYDDGQPLTAGDLTLVGKMGMIRLIDEEVESMTLIGGSMLQKGEKKIEDSGAAVGNVLDTSRLAAGDSFNGFLVDSSVSSSFIGQHIVVTHPDGRTHGYKIEDITDSDRGTMIDIGNMDPGFTVEANGTSEMEFLPFLRWNGTHTFRIENSKSRTFISSLLATLSENREDIYSEGAYRSLEVHLTAVRQFESQETADKMVKHLGTFMLLLDNHMVNEMLSKRLYHELKTSAESIVEQWR